MLVEATTSVQLCRNVHRINSNHDTCPITVCRPCFLYIQSVSVGTAGCLGNSLTSFSSFYISSLFHLSPTRNSVGLLIDSSELWRMRLWTRFISGVLIASTVSLPCTAYATLLSPLFYC